MKTSLIIPAAGFGTRMKDFLYPKMLLPLYNISIIQQIVDFWGADEVIIVTRPETLDMIRQYTEDKYHYVTDSRRGSGYAVQSGLQVSSGERIILNWCDVLPLEKPEETGNIFLTSLDIKCSFNGEKGGIYGVFLWNRDEIEYSSQLPDLDREVTLLDAIDINDFQEIVVPAIDIGDMEKYTEDLMSCSKPVRSFNKITMKEDVVVKECSDDRLRLSEENWYKKMKGFEYIPEIISYNPLKMQRIRGIQKFHEVEPLYKLARLIHSFKPPISSSEGDCKKVYIDKAISRVKEIEYLVNFGDKFIVNGVECTNPLVNIQKVDIKEMVPEQFVPIHGDLTTSNVLWEDDRPYIIDPRGVFGTSFFYGDSDYDIAKIYYSKTNWHLLNKGLLVPKRISINSFITEDVEPFGDRKIDFLLASIWLSVTSYVKSNVLSVAYSYLLGSLLLQQWINKYKVQ